MLKLDVDKHMRFVENLAINCVGMSCGAGLRNSFKTYPQLDETFCYRASIGYR